LEVGGWRLEAGGWRLEAAGWGLEVGGWRLEVGRALKNGEYRGLPATGVPARPGRGAELA
jgi:hypothetical protein